MQTTQLNEQKCEACHAQAPQATQAQKQQWMSELAGWRIQTEQGVEQLYKAYSFKNFVQALEFTNKVGELAESANHHPKIITEWGKVTLVWWTHKINGLHKNDFICAAKSDQI